jgi:hypothetical protein
MTTISNLPSPPVSGDSAAGFVSKADALFAALPTMVTQINTVASEMDTMVTNAATYKNEAAASVALISADPAYFTATCAGTITPALGALSAITVESGRSFAPGMCVMVAKTSAPTTNWFHAIVTAYSGTSLTLNVDQLSAAAVAGSGWTITMSGPLKYVKTTGTSSSTITPSLASKSLTVQTGLDYVPGMFVLVSSTAAPATNWGHGVVTSYNAGTGALVMTMSSVGSAPASASSWNVTLSPPPNSQNTLGVGQTWQSVTRTSGTVYQNTTPVPITIAVTAEFNVSNQAEHTITVGTTESPTLDIAKSVNYTYSEFGLVTYATLTAVIPPGWYYKSTLTRCSLHLWRELR